ncbi:DUF1640 domain-containing protein, partial [Corallococcus sp. AB049A]|uniref:coiled-coil domain-containing protein n=1 Tax=Corallococcus sp. AB049A TaxID=2316721 RepID=UPI000ECC63EE
MNPRRGVVIHAPGPDSSPIIEQNAGGSYSAASSGPSASSSNSSSINASPSSSSSQHPYASLEGVFEKNGESSGMTETLPVAPEVPVPLAQHPFDTHAFVTYLEKSELSPKAARALMESTRQMIVDRSGKTKERMLHKEDMENVR